ncbi:hypothetical protein [Legionella londiniensis]|uniref:Structural toxin protein (Hemagglutinin/hemolysin) RtxA n=1 Tax=Legionella londiniensis TaxID=45068 RepID=A0A0W0VN26_9GAMM|nr:hypothetical protein [Legionella londiniensis]KTD21145.1 structural toxin protein (hemagglutinin/hemolysin) RtxA [Legionella londiniensis]STX93167.1 structural toxin protein (hemagglutinin/hemolysin) RtxA [Legionella londiniensis]
MYYQLTFYVPESHLETVKNALFAAGAGKIGDYDHACWQCLGQGQFRPLAGANPTIGKPEELSYVAEYKVEMLCDVDLIHEIVHQLKKAHPYEEPAYAVTRIEQF